MPEQSLNHLNDLLSSSFGQSAVAAAGPLPLPALPCGPITPAVVDPETVVASIFRTKLDLSDRNALIRALTAAFPLQQPGDGGKPVIAFRGHDPSLLNLEAGAVVGPQAAALVSAQTLAAQASSLSSIKPLDAHAPEGHGVERLVPLIRDTIAEIVAALARPGQLTGDRVEVLLAALCGYHAQHWTYLDIHNVGGYLGELRDRCHLDLKNATSDADERMLTTFTTVVALTGMLAQTWHAQRDFAAADDYFGVGIYELRRYFFAIVHALNELHRMVPAAQWATTVLPTRHPVIAGELWQWMYTFASAKAMQLLAQGERSALRLIALTMSSFAESVRDGLLEPQPAEEMKAPYLEGEDARIFVQGNTSYSDAYEGLPEDYCGTLPWPFRRKRVRAVIAELLCHIQRVLEIVRNLSEDAVSVSHVVFHDADNKPVTELRGATIAYAVVFGELPHDTAVDLVLRDDVDPLCGELVCNEGGGLKYKFYVGTAPAGIWTAEVKVGEWRRRPKERLVLLPELQPHQKTAAQSDRQSPPPNLQSPLQSPPQSKQHE